MLYTHLYISKWANLANRHMTQFFFQMLGNMEEKSTLTLFLILHQSYYGYCNVDETYKMDRSLLWRHRVMTMHSIPCHLPLDNKLGTCMAHPDGGRALSTGTLYQNTHHESCPSEDSSGLAHHRTPFVAGSCECPPPVQNPPTEHNNKEDHPIFQSRKREKNTLYIQFKQSSSRLFHHNISFCFSYLTKNSNSFSRVQWLANTD
jgi:hypothetical protein